MKTILGFFCFSFSIIFCQSANFSYKEIAEQNIQGHAEKVATTSSLWLSNHINILRLNKYKLYLKYSQSVFFKEINGLNWVLPSFQFGLKPTDNLMVSGKFFGVHLYEESPQIIGGGLHYIAGEDQDWVISFQKSALNGVNDFRVVSTLFHIDKRLQKSFYDFFIGFGINYFVSKSYFSSPGLPKKIEGELNYISLAIAVPYKTINMCASSQLSLENQLFHLALVKGF